MRRILAVARNTFREGARQRPHSDGVVVELSEGADVNAFLAAAITAGTKILSVSPRKESLEDLFVREAQAQPAGAQA